MRIIPEWFGGGTLTRKELNEAAEELLADEAGLIVVGEANIEPALDKVFAGTAKVVKREMVATSTDHQRAARSVQRLTRRAPRDHDHPNRCCPTVPGRVRCVEHGPAHRLRNPTGRYL